jgi:hypothetical protein
MLKDLYNLNNRSFLENLELDLLPAILNYLRIHPQKQIIWMLQTPSTDLLAPISKYSYNDKIHIKKIQDYNNIVRRVFKYCILIYYILNVLFMHYLYNI